MKDYKYKVTLRSTLCAIMINNSADLFKFDKKIHDFDGKDFLALRKNVILAVRALKNIIVASRTLLYKDFVKLYMLIKKSKDEEEVKELKRLKEKFKDGSKHIMQALAALESERFSQKAIEEFSLRTNTRIFTLMKRIGIELGQLINKKKDVRKFEIEEKDIEKINHFAIIIIHRYKETIKKVKKNQPELITCERYLHKIEEKLLKASRYQTHEMERMIG